MSVSEEDIEFWEEERIRIEEDPTVLDSDYEDVTDEFLPAEVDALLADFEMGTFQIEKFHQLSRENQNIFLQRLSEEFQSKKKSA